MKQKKVTTLDVADLLLINTLIIRPIVAPLLAGAIKNKHTSLHMVTSTGAVCDHTIQTCNAVRVLHKVNRNQSGDLSGDH